ncbi:MAG: ABC transporter permease, partial [Acidobacteriota bacterium]
MNITLETIPFLNLALSFAPVVIVLAILYRWSLSCGTAIYAVLRMVAQLLLVGYVLTFLFESTSAPMVLATLSIMLAAASWIALRPLSRKSKTAYLKALGSISA